MLKFRPIAPKPTAGELFTGSLLLEDKALIFKKRTKRKYVRSIGKNTHRRRNTKTTGSKAGSVDQKKTVTTLKLLPEKSDEENSTATSTISSDYDLKHHSCFRVTRKDQPTWINFGHFMNPNRLDRTVVESWVTIDCITDQCMEVEKLGDTDIERIMNLEMSSCPCFISNGCNKVKWVNEAYWDMTNGYIGERQEVFVWLVIKEELVFPYLMYPAFTCRANIRYLCGNRKGSVVLPCDAWRMDCGDFGWKLDMKAALSLGR